MRRGLIAVTFWFFGFFTPGIQALELNGRVHGTWVVNSFTLETRSDATTFWLDVPYGKRLLVQTETDGEVVKRWRVTVPGEITLSGMKEWTVRLLWDSTDCTWGCRLASGEEPVLKTVQGYADTAFAFRWTLVTEEAEERWNFHYPREATFIVRLWSPSGTRASEQDLAERVDVSLSGPGVFTVEVDPIDGGGEFSAERMR